MGHRIKEIRKRLGEIAAVKDAYNLGRETRSNGVSRSVWRETHSHVHLHEVVGRDVDRDAILEHLLCPDNARNSFVVSIVGMGGLGKTTLAKFVYNDNRTETRFETRIWVCVSGDLNVKQIPHKIVPGNHDNVDLEQLQEKLREHLRGKRFLLILDDVWNENRREWRELRGLLTNGSTGSRVIVTTRSSNVASAAGSCYEHKLQGLSHGNCMTVLKKMCEDGQPELVESEILGIAGQIVQKCGGVPLMVKALGGLLNSNTDVSYWRSIVNKDIFSLLRNEDDVLPIIKLSYDHLLPHLKMCLQFCSLFPKGYEFYNIALRVDWKSVGLIDWESNVQSHEEVADGYMKELLARSFFQDYVDYGAVFGFKMHDLVHDLVLFVGQNEFFTANPNMRSIPCQVRHVSFSLASISNKDEGVVLPTLLSFTKPNKYRTFMLREVKGISGKLLEASISNSKYLRLLHLGGTDFEAMPASIGTLKHLRLLNLTSNVRIRSLPSSICDLQNLQVLWLEGCESLEELPRNMWKLINLEQLAITTKQRSLKSIGIEKLNSLNFLLITRCNNIESLFKEDTDVKGLSALQALSIVDCASLASVPVKKLKFLTSLEVMHVAGCEKINISMDKEPFPLALRTLSICDLPFISTLPEWLVGSADTLESLELDNFEQLEELPEWLGKFRHLRRLAIFRCRKLVSLPDVVHGLKALKLLKIWECGELSERCQANRPEWHKIAHIPEIRFGGKRYISRYCRDPVV